MRFSTVTTLMTTLAALLGQYSLLRCKLTVDLTAFLWWYTRALTSISPLYDRVQVPRIEAACTALLMTTGFGIATVQACATELYARHLGVSLSEAFVPSSRWCYDFLRNIMHLSRRRVTGTRCSPGQSTKTRHFNLNSRASVRWLLVVSLDS